MAEKIATDNQFRLAAAGIDSAVSGGLVTGYPDGTFQANRCLSKIEALSLIQNCLESYSRK